MGKCIGIFFLGCKKTVPNLLHILVRDRLPGIIDPYADICLLLAQSDPDMPAHFRVFESIHHVIVHRLLNVFTVAEDQALIF